MHLDNLKIQLALTIPFGRPDRSGVMYSKEAVEKAVRDFSKKLPILYDNMVIGNTVGETCSVLWSDEQQVCEVIINGNLYYSGVDYIVNDIKDGVVTDFQIKSVGVAR